MLQTLLTIQLKEAGAAVLSLEKDVINTLCDIIFTDWKLLSPRRINGCLDGGGLWSMIVTLKHKELCAVCRNLRDEKLISGRCLPPGATPAGRQDQCNHSSDQDRTAC
tara:strand:- start:522 stop:845 length:324 start_codon:yes stop_codon:yes gene_type:complete